MKSRALPAQTPYRFLLALAIAVCAMLGAISPASAYAEGHVAYVQDSTGKYTYYTDERTAVSAAYGSDKTLVLLADWKLGSTLDIADSKELTIDMNGYTIAMADKSAGWYSESICLKENAKLTIKSSQKRTITYEGTVKDSDGKWKTKETKITSGGLITNEGSMGGAGIHMDSGSTLTITGVAVAGCSKSGIETKTRCTVNLNEGTVLTANTASSSGAGIEVGGDSTLNMNGAQIIKNHSNGQGGGVFAGSNVNIYLEGGSKISENEAWSGGGVYLDYSKFTLESVDGTGEISGNVALENGPAPLKTRASGGGIHVDKSSYSANSGSIKNLKIINNYSYWDGGGIELDQQNTVIEKCTITGNGAYYEGGGIYVCNKNNTIKDTVIQNNYCNDCGSNYEGGGVYVWCDYDIKLEGTVNITGNTRGYKSGNADNLFLRDNAGSTARAYITGGVSKDSKIGVRTGVTGDRRIGKGIENNEADSFYMDMSGYYVSYGADEGGDMWQRTGETDYAVTLDGKSLGRYKPGTMVTVSGETSSAVSAFLRWSTKSTGLAPFDDYFDNVYYSKVTFYMPKNDVKLVTDTIFRTSYFTLSVAKPLAGGALPSTGTLGWGDGNTKQVDLRWLDENGKVATQAEYGAKYRFYILVDESRKDDGLAFAADIEAKNVSINYSDSIGSIATQDAHVDADDRLNVTSDWIEMSMPSITNVESAAITVTAGITRESVLTMLPGAAWADLENDTRIALATDKTATIEGLDSFITLNGLVKEPDEGDHQVYTVKMPLAQSDKVATVEGKYLEVTVTVLKSADIAPPALSPAAGTYEGTSLKVEATCSTDDVTVLYQVDGGTTQTYDAATGIVLTGEANASTEHTVTAWAQRSTGSKKESTHVSATYTLDDTRAKLIHIKCSDTALYREGDTRWSDQINVRSDIGRTITITAPGKDGRDFDHWEWADAPEGTDLSKKTLEIKDFSTDYDGKITAVYTPIITAVDLEVAAPAAHEILSQGASAVKIKTGSGDAWTDVTEYFTESPRGAATITWSPAGDEAGAAEHLTSYTATLKLKSGSATPGVKYTMADDLDLWVNGEKAAEDSAWISEKDGTKCLNALFPETGKYVYKEMDELDDVDISFADAVIAQSAQDAGAEGDWGLAKEIGLTFACGETDLVDVEWECVEGFDPAKLEAQTLTVKGTVKYPDYVDATDAPQTVEVTVHVAAPEHVAAPTASIDSGTYAGTQVLGLSCATDGAVIRYTTDGSEPDENSPEYDDDAIEVAHTMTIKAKAFCEGMAPSETATFAYTITHRVAFDAAGGSAVTAQIVTDGEAAAEPAAPTRAGYSFKGWTLDGAAYDFATPVTGDLTLTATWEKNGDDPDVDPDVDPDDPDVDPDVDPDGKGDKGDEQPDGKGDGKKDDSKKRETLPGTGDVSALAGIVAASGAALAALGARSRRKR